MHHAGAHPPPLPDAREECWHIYYGDVHAGTISIRTGNPNDTDPWQWHCGFYLGCHPGEHTNGTAPTFEEARADFEQAWAVFLSKRTAADFQAWRAQRDSTARKYALWDAGKQLPPNEWEPGKPCSIFMKCACGVIFNSHLLQDTVIHVPHISAVYIWSRVASCLGIQSFMNRSRYRVNASRL
jgi:hypothetical protein